MSLLLERPPPTLPGPGPRPRRRPTHGVTERALLVATVLVAAASVLTAWTVSGSAPGWVPAALTAELPQEVRASIAVAAACWLPGVPLVVLLRPASSALGAALATSTSLAVTVLVSLGTLMAGAWDPVLSQTVLVSASLVLVPAAWAALPPVRRGGLTAALRGAAVLPLHRLVGWSALGAAVALFALQAAELDVSTAGDLGLVAVVGWPLLACLAALGLATATGLLARRPDPLVLAPALAVLVLVVTSLVSAASGETSTPTAWVHRGFADVISATGQLPPPFDARMSWAGFFAMTSHLVAVAGLPDATVLLAPAPVVVDVLLLAPLFVIGRAVTGRARTAWLGLVLVVVTDWYQQDYFAPQALALLWLTTVLACVLWWWRATAPAPVTGTRGERGRALLGAWRTTPTAPPGTSAVAVWGTEALLVLLLAALVVTHQLTPMVAVGSLAVVAALGATRFRTLWLVAGLAFTAWFSFGAQGFWSGHLAALLGDVGQVSSSLEGGVTERVGTVPLHQAGQVLRLASSGGLALLALTGWWLRRHRRGALLVGLLAGLPFGLVAVQSYGGEVVIRCFVLATPLLAPLAAEAVERSVAALSARSTRRSRSQHDPRLAGAGTALVVVAAVVLGGLLATTTRGLNASFERTSTREVAVADALEAAVPSGTWIATLGNAPYLITERSLTDVRLGAPVGTAEAPCADDVAACTLQERPDYFLLTPTQQAQGLYSDGREPGWLDAVQAQLLASGQYVAQVDDADVVLLRRADVTEIGSVR